MLVQNCDVNLKNGGILTEKPIHPGLKLALELGPALLFFFGLHPVSGSHDCLGRGKLRRIYHYYGSFCSNFVGKHRDFMAAHRQTIPYADFHRRFGCVFWRVDGVV